MQRHAVVGQSMRLHGESWIPFEGTPSHMPEDGPCSVFLDANKTVHIAVPESRDEGFAGWTFKLGKEKGYHRRTRTVEHGKVVGHFKVTADMVRITVKADGGALERRCVFHPRAVQVA